MKNEKIFPSWLLGVVVKKGGMSRIITKIQKKPFEDLSSYWYIEYQKYYYGEFEGIGFCSLQHLRKWGNKTLSEVNSNNI